MPTTIGPTMARQPEDVFTPKTIASREMFERRNEADLDGNPGLQDNLRDALREAGGQVILYGDTGVGKSSLLRYAAEDEDLDAVVIECLSSKSYEDLMEDAIRKLVDVKEISRTSTNRVGAEAEGEFKVKWLVSLKGKLTGEREKAREFEVVQETPFDALLSAMRASKTSLIVFDNFQNISDSTTRHLIAQTMEFLSDRAAETGDVKAVVIGIAEDAPSLLGGSGSFRRRVTEIGVPRMPDDEIRAILVRGFHLLDVTVGDDVLDRLVFFSDGFPFFAHLLGLHLSRWARRQSDHVVSRADIDKALKRAISSVDRSYAQRVEKAFEAGGEIQPRKSLLKIFAQSDRREWKSPDVIAAWEANYGARDAYQFLHVALAALLDDEHGKILRRKGTRNKYVYQFEDPYMRPYLRLTQADT
ncbi:AAA family ATPase [Blastococcus sp. SYSU DS0828]